MITVFALTAISCQHRVVQSGQTMPGDYGIFLFAWQLSSCPGPDYLPPHKAEGGGVRVEAGYHDGPYCHDFIKYSIDSGNLSYSGTSPLYLRVHRDARPGCSLYAAMPVARLCTGVPLSQCRSYQTALAETRRALALLLAGAPGAAPVATPNESTLNATGFADPQAFEAWCAKRIRARYDSTSNEIFHIPTNVQ